LEIVARINRYRFEIDQIRTHGRKIELQLKHDDLIVPVILSYKHALLHTLKLRDNPLNFQPMAMRQPDAQPDRICRSLPNRQ